MKKTRFFYPACACLLLAYTVFLALFSHAGFPSTMRVATHLPFLCDKPMGEDGYYMLKVAWNLASGKGAVGNEGESVTGIQPLSTLLFALIAKIVQIGGGSKWTFVRAIIFFGGLNLIVFAFLIGKIAQTINGERENQRLVFALGSGLALFNFWLFYAFTYGLETGVYMTLLAGLVLFTLTRLPSVETTDAMVIGVLAGLCAWARIDFGVIFGVFLLIAWLWRLMNLRQAFWSGLAALILIGPWFVYVYAVSGAIMPSSGPAQSQLISMASVGERLASMAKALLGHLTPWTSSHHTAVDFLALAALTVFIYYRRINLIQILGGSRIYAAWGLAVAVLAPLYIVFFWARHFYERYTMPLLCVLLPFFAVVLVALLAKMKRQRVMVYVFFLMLIMSFALFAWRTLHIGRIGTLSVNAGFVGQYIPATTRVGAFQNGVVGYFNDNVINLDGKVNSRALKALQTNSIEKYIDAVDIAVIIDWGPYIHRYLREQWLTDYWQPCARQPANDNVCLLRKSADKK